MTIKHIQARVTEEEFKKIKKKAVDLGIHLEDFLKLSALEKVENENTKRKGDLSGEVKAEGDIQDK
jgi:hypothetical protein